MSLRLAGAIVLCAAATLFGQQNSATVRSASTASPVRLSATAHPPVPTALSAMWFAPSQQSAPLSPALADFVRGVRLLDEQSNAAAALPLVSAKALSATPLADYARYYTGLALLRLARYAAADAVFAELASGNIDGHLPEDSALRQAEVREAQRDFVGAVIIYESLVDRKLAQPQVAWFKLGGAAELAGNRARAVEALRKVYFEYSLSPEADQAGAALTRLGATIDVDLAPKELARAEALFRFKRWAPARASYDRAKEFVTGLDRDRLAVHRAACDVSLGRHREGRDALRAELTGPFADEANFYFITATRGLKEKGEHARLARTFVETHPASPWAEEVLNGLATAYIIDDEDEKADGVFREMLAAYPDGRSAERAAWKAGWWAYRKGRFADAARFFDQGALMFPRSDYRPSWLYWSGRAAEQMGEATLATSRFELTATDYHNSYYGRLALTRLRKEAIIAVAPSVQRGAPGAASPPIPTARRIEVLLATGLNREALGELQYAQRIWGDSPRIQATMALVQLRLGNVRAGINGMKRAYPQYLAAGGEALPPEILKVIFPVDYWPLLQQYATSRGLDPFVVAALVAQESNFDPVVRSSAKAVGLMQVLPSTGRAYARKLGIRPFSTDRLTNAEINVRIGTTIFLDTIKKFGGVHFALAAYNAGDSRVVAWQRERPGWPQDEFIDDIPFAETQGYVKRILGTAEDYRSLYGPKRSN